MRAALFVIVLVLSGCVPSFAEIRALPPIEAVDLSGDHKDIAACTLDDLRLLGDMHLEPTAQPVKRIAGVANVDSKSRFVAWELSLRQISEIGVRAELRSRKSLWGTPNAPAAVMSIARSCAKRLAKSRGET